VNQANSKHGRSTHFGRPIRFVHQAHDELVYILPTSELDGLKQIIHHEMTTPPKWGNDLPLVADVVNALRGLVLTKHYADRTKPFSSNCEVNQKQNARTFLA